MSALQDAYSELLAEVHDLGVHIIPWENCHRGELLGFGASVSVFSGTCMIDNTERDVAFKFINMRLTEKTRKQKIDQFFKAIRQELHVMSSLKGQPRVIQLIGVSFNNSSPVLIVELANKFNLEEYLQENDVDWKTKLNFAYDTLLGLESVHAAGIIHGDIKAANMLLVPKDDDSELMITKLSDFGFSTTDQEGQNQGFTNRFRARELFDPELREWSVKPTIDLYSYGLLVWQIATGGEMPFRGMDEVTINNIKKSGTELDILMSQLPTDTPAEIRKVISVTVRNMPMERASLSDIKSILKESI